MVAGEIFIRASATIGGSLPKSWAYPGSQRGKMALRRFEQGRFAASQICFKGFRISSL